MWSVRSHDYVIRADDAAATTLRDRECYHYLLYGYPRAITATASLLLPANTTTGNASYFELLGVFQVACFSPLDTSAELEA